MQHLAVEAALLFLLLVLLLLYKYYFFLVFLLLLLGHKDVMRENARVPLRGPARNRIITWMVRGDFVSGSIMGIAGGTIWLTVGYKCTY